MKSICRQMDVMMAVSIVTENAGSSEPWSEVANSLDKVIARDGTWHQRFDINPKIERLIGDVRGKAVLDLCCGTGHFARRLERLGALVTAIDYSSRMIEIARTHSDEVSNIVYRIADASDLSAEKSGYFDVCVCNMGPMDIRNCEAAFAEVSRVLRRGGHFIFSMTHPVFDFQPWRYVRVRKNAVFAKAVFRYLSESSEPSNFAWANGASVCQYHRPIQTYVSWLFASGMLIDTLLEVPTTKPLQATDDKHISRERRALYFDDHDRKVKEVAGNELPAFLVIRAVRS